MATIISIKRKIQGLFKDWEDDGVWKSSPETQVVDIDYPIIAKGNKIEGIEARY